MPLQLCELALPWAKFFLHLCLFLNSVDKPELASFFCRVSRHSDSIIGHQLDVRFTTWLLILIFDFIVSITHSCDEKVKKEDLANEGRKNENKPCPRISILVLEVFKVEFAESQQVLVQHGIQEIQPEEVLVELAVVVTAFVENQKSISKSREQKREYYQNTGNF